MNVQVIVGLAMIAAGILLLAFGVIMKVKTHELVWAVIAAEFGGMIVANSLVGRGLPYVGVTAFFALVMGGTFYLSKKTVRHDRGSSGSLSQP